MEAMARKLGVTGKCAHCGTGILRSLPKTSPPEGVVWRAWARLTGARFFWVECRTCESFTFHAAKNERGAIAAWNRDKRETVLPSSQGRIARWLVGW